MLSRGNRGQGTGKCRRAQPGKLMPGRTPSPDSRPVDVEEMALYDRMKGTQGGPRRRAAEDGECLQPQDPARP